VQNFTLLLLYSFLALFPSQNQQRKFQITGHAQGTTFQIAYYAADSIVTASQIDSILQKIDSSLSIYKPYSLINSFNNSKTGIKADEHLQIVVRKALETYSTTGKIFDITVQPLVKAWGFGVKTNSSLPDSATIRSLKKCVGSNMIHLKGDMLVKDKPCVTIDVNGIAQGYSVDVIASFIEKAGINNYIVELGGEIRIKGRRQPGNEPMKIGIEAPPDSPFDPEVMQKVISIEGGAVTTSGSYRKYYESNGKRISHIIDPRSGYPMNNELISVTVYAKDAITADAYDNALMVMGLSRAMKFVDDHPEIAANFIYRQADGYVADTATRVFSSFMLR
jgi:FAD:protein FMN transferase